MFLNHHCYTSGLSWSLKISKNNYSPNDRFLIKIFIKIISLDSSQRVPPMSPCPPLIITRVCPWLINHLSDPWNSNKSNGILLRSNWRKPYPKFYGSELLIIKGWSRKLTRRYPPYLLGGVINPVLALYHNTSSPLIFGTQNTNHFADGFPTLSLPSCCFPCPHVAKFAFVSAPRVDQWGGASFMKSETTIQKEYVAGEITLWFNPGSMMLVETSTRKGSIPHPKQRQHGWDITH